MVFRRPYVLFFSSVLVAEIKFKNGQSSKDLPLSEAPFLPILQPM